MEFLTSNDEAAAFVAPPAAAACAPEQPPSAVDLTFDTVQHSRDFFREAGVVFALLREVVSSCDHEHDEPDKNPCDASDVEHQKRKELLAEKRAKAEEVKRIWNLYQEQPALLDGSLREMVDILFQGLPLHSVASASMSTASSVHASHSRRPCWGATQHLVCSLLYFLCAVRGYKRVVQCFPHEVADLVPVVGILESHVEECNSLL